MREDGSVWTEQALVLVSAYISLFQKTHYARILTLQGNFSYAQNHQ